MKYGFALSMLAAAMLTATPAMADESKDEAILGGKSRLAAILEGQSAAPLPAAAAASPSIAPAMLRPAMPVSEDRPDVFGTVAIPLASSPLDARWASASSANFSGAAAGYVDRIRHLDDLARLEAINHYVNAHVHFVNDQRAWGVADRWGSASETLGREAGDCEDFALAKMAMARRAGFAAKDLYLVVLKDLVRRADHAVLVVRAQGRFLVLDNGTDRLVDSDQIHDYRPILTFTQGKRFTHGYRRDLTNAPVIMAAAGRVESPARPAATMVDYAMAEARPLPVSMFAAPSPASAPRRR